MTRPIIASLIKKEINDVVKNSGNPEMYSIEISRPLPCLVILVHGINDIGEAYPELDKGICAGLNKHRHLDRINGIAKIKPTFYQGWDKIRCKIGAEK